MCRCTAALIVSFVHVAAVQAKRGEDFRLIVMSATLDAAKFAGYFPGAKVGVIETFKLQVSLKSILGRRTYRAVASDHQSKLHGLKLFQQYSSTACKMIILPFVGYYKRHLVLPCRPALSTVAHSLCSCTTQHSQRTTTWTQPSMQCCR